ncbi:patatin-like phospholipase family protein [Demequina zhanjiangensis]|uniref:Patatin-like phospholipase family protein n=1 Tax=Demequina zhanjiangensis TaxID=3051659 RepID=A0ABT8FXS8_9MICO|nr:patatin-like phospholipase family protein [Demequina sp. SYSU T00b26]MDN4471715.1 patatin-like phospholipase family protein [Demequina sp. SYSU T00b26]
MEDRTDLRYAPRLGLALGGGGALGAAHVGVLQVLHERGIRPELVVGTSAGSVIGAAYAAGMDPYELEEMVLRAQWGDFGTFSFMPGLGLLDTDGLRRTIDEVAGGDLLIEDLPIRFAAVATDLATGSAVLLSEGSLADAMSASIAVPGLFRPQRLAGHLLVDGGVVQNLPLPAAFEIGASDVIGVRLAAEWDALPRYRTGTQVHELEIDSHVTMVRPQIGQRSQWVARDLPGLIQLGREAAERELAHYAVVEPRPVDEAGAAAARAAADEIRSASSSPLSTVRDDLRARADEVRERAEALIGNEAAGAVALLRRRDRRDSATSSD